MAASAVVAQTITLERDLGDAVNNLTDEAIGSHPLWSYTSVYLSPKEGVPGVISECCRDMLIDKLDRVDREYRQLVVLVARLQLICSQPVSDAAEELIDDVLSAWSSTEACVARAEAEEAVFRLIFDRRQMVEAVRADLGLVSLLSRSTDVNH
jgi:hypothetical protein